MGGTAPQEANVAFRCFAGDGLHGALPGHPSLTRIRRRWGAGLFRRVFARTVGA